MKIQFTFLLTGSLFYLVRCKDLIIPTNYTLSYLKDLNNNWDKMTCETDKDCPPYSKCETFNINRKDHSVCRFGDFICMDDYLNNNNKPCVFVNTDIYDLNNHVFLNGFSKPSTPIIKTCEKFEIDKKICKTETCHKNEDCLSGKCYKNTCIFMDDMFRCSGNKQKQYMKCGKFDYLECNDNDECYHGECSNKVTKKIYYCDSVTELQKTKKQFMLFIVSINIIYICILMCPLYNIYKHKFKLIPQNYIHIFLMITLIIIDLILNVVMIPTYSNMNKSLKL